MKTKFLWGAAWRTALAGAVIATPIWYFNRSPDWTGADAIAEAQRAPVSGKAGLVVVALLQPEQFESDFYVNFVEKLFVEAIPWPVNQLAGRDSGVVLIDPTQPYMTKRFEPRELVDLFGSTKDVDGTPWLTRYRDGELRWEPPSRSIPHDPGVFLYPARKQGMRFPAAKTSIKARYIYYPQLPDGMLPQYRQTWDMARGAIDITKSRHPQIVAGMIADAFNPEQKRRAIEGVLDAGVDTLILTSAQPVYSDFEELEGSFVGVEKIVQDWRARNGDKAIRIVVPPYMASREEYDRLLLTHFARSVPTASKPGQSATGILTNHGLPPSQYAKDSWSARISKAADRLLPQMESILREKGYSNVHVTMAAEGFADDLEDPDDALLSVHEAYLASRGRGDAIAAAMPLDFPAENTDNLFAHAAIMFEDFPGYKTYQGPPADVDWQEPYIREFQLGETKLLYLGSPGGKTVPQQSRALADAVSTLFAR